MRILICTGAYGRIATLNDWYNAKDFRVRSGPYFSIRDIELLRKNYDKLVFIYPFTNNVLFSVNLHE